MKPTGCITLVLLVFTFLILTSLMICAQERILIKGTVYDRDTQEPIIGAHITASGSNVATTTDSVGTFSLEVPGTPVNLVITYIGYETSVIEVRDKDSRKALKVYMEAGSVLLNEAQISGDARMDVQRNSALSINSIEYQDLRAVASSEVMDGLGILPGTDAFSAGMGFTIHNTRGFSSTSPVRSLQIIDGVDNQSPGLNFSLGNFLGAPDLDILRVELIQGPASAFYGPNAFNGVIDIRTRDPFIHQGLEASVKYGERNLLKGELRYAKAFQNSKGEDKFAFKINGALMLANDWEATNDDPTFQSKDDETNPGGYDAVNIYGDEYSDDRDYTGKNSLVTFPGLNRFYRRGYRESELVDYDTENYKGSLGLYFKPDSAIQISSSFNFGSGTTIYQGENRFQLKDIFFWQGKVEIKRDGKFFLRAYMTEEDAGKTYDTYATALLLQTAVKSEHNWNLDYLQYWQTFIRGRVTSETPSDSLRKWHAQSQAYANSKNFRGSAFAEPGTARFDSLFNLITQNLPDNPKRPGTRFYDRSGLFHVHGEYRFTPSFGEITAGANFRQYNPDSKGTIFSDTSGRKIINREFGIYGGISRDLIPDKLKFNFSTRFDKNQNFKLVVSPAASCVWTPDEDNVFRIAFSSALRNPTMADQYLHLDVGRALLLGNLSGYDSLITPESFQDYRYELNLDTLVYFDEPPIQPEKVKSIEIGYRGSPGDRLWIDASYYHSWYRDFIGYRVGIRTDFMFIYPVNTEVLRISANAASRVTTQGCTVSAAYQLLNNFSVSGNYSWNVLNKKGTDDPIIPAFNTPEHKFNLGFSGRDISLPIGNTRWKSFGFSINYKWIEGFLFEGSPQFTGPIPTYDLMDAQINWHHARSGVTLKVGATNFLNKKQYQVYGGPRVGRLAYLSFLYESKHRSIKRN